MTENKVSESNQSPAGLKKDFSLSPKEKKKGYIQDIDLAKEMAELTNKQINSRIQAGELKTKGSKNMAAAISGPVNEKVATRLLKGERDSLTGLFSRGQFEERMKDKLKEAKRNQWSILFVVADLNELKKINDGLGHIAGDKALKIVANGLKKTRQTDVWGRTGGDEFSGMLVAKEQEMELICGKIVNQINQATAGENYSVKVSFGVKAVSLDKDSKIEPDKWLGQADELMYIAKQASKKGDNTNRLGYRNKAGETVVINLDQVNTEQEISK